MSWNYRVFRRKYPQSTTPIVKRDMYVLCETYYDEKGKPIMWSTEPEAGPCESVSELIEIKKGEWSLERVERLADELFAQAHEALIHSPLPLKPDRERAEALCQEILAEWFDVRRLTQHNGGEG